MSRRHTLDDRTYKKILDLSKEGDDLADSADYSKALEKYYSALDLIPKPYEEWEASTWLLSAIADSYFKERKFKEAFEVLKQCMRCPDAIGNPFIHLRIGQSAYELGDLDRSSDELMRAYMGGGPEIFSEDDPKYFEFIRTLI